jgi:hypothetical protein
MAEDKKERKKRKKKEKKAKEKGPKKLNFVAKMYRQHILSTNKG